MDTEKSTSTSPAGQAEPARKEIPPLKGPRCRYVFPSTGVLCFAPLYMCSHPQPGSAK